MSEEDRERFFTELEKRGEASVRADLATAKFGARTALAIEWLGTKEQERARKAERRDEQMLRATQQSADAAARAAKWAVIAAIAAVVAALAAVASFVWPLIPH